MRRGNIERYPCDCTDPGNVNAVCWIVRYPGITPSVSYTTEYGARMRLVKAKPGERSTELYSDAITPAELFNRARWWETWDGVPAGFGLACNEEVDRNAVITEPL